MTRSKQQPFSTPLGGVDKATALLLTMSKASADRIIKQFEDSDIRAVARSAIDLPTVECATLSLVIDELGSLLEAGEMLAGSSQGAKDLLSGVVADVDAYLGVQSDPSSNVWQQIARVPDQVLVDFISTEETQVGAYLLSRLEPDKASAVLGTMDVARQSALSLRLMSLTTISDVANRLIESHIAEKLLKQTTDNASTDNYARLAAILNQMRRDQTSAILERLDADRPDDTRQVRQFVFSFEDIIALSAEDRMRLFDQVPAERTVLAIRECDPALQSAVIAALSPRSRRIVEAELSSLGSTSEAAILDARRAIARDALSLAAQSVISLGAPTSGSRT